MRLRRTTRQRRQTPPRMAQRTILAAAVLAAGCGDANLPSRYEEADNMFGPTEAACGGDAGVCPQGPEGVGVRKTTEALVDSFGEDSLEDVGHRFALGEPLAFTNEDCFGRRDSYDGFGDALAVGDFDGDGDKDLAVGAPGDNFGTGLIYTFRNTGSGFEPWQKLDEPNTTFVKGMGTRIVTGDIDGDGRDDLVASGFNSRTFGTVHVFTSSERGLLHRYKIDADDLLPEWRNHQLGAGLSLGDFDGNGKLDLAVGAPGSPESRHSDAGFVLIFRGNANGYFEFWHGIRQPGGESRTARFGTSLASGDINGDGYDDLAIGAPGAAEGEGAVFTFVSAPLGLISNPYLGFAGRSASASAAAFPVIGFPAFGRQLRFKQTLSRRGSDAEAAMGTALAIGDIDHDSLPDVVAGAPGSNSVSIFPGSSSGELGREEQRGVFSPDFEGFGETLSFGRFGGQYEELAVGTREGGFSVLRHRSWPREIALSGTPGGLVAIGDSDSSYLIASSRKVRVFDKDDTRPSETLHQQAPGCRPTWPDEPVIKILSRGARTASYRVTADDRASKLYVNVEGAGINSTTRVDGHVASGTFDDLTPRTTYCANVRACSEFICSSSSECFDTRPEEPSPPPAPPPPPPQPAGVKSIAVYNCHPQRRSIELWTFNQTRQLWQHHGRQSEQYTNAGCGPGAGSTPKVVDLTDGHMHAFVAVDPNLTGCGENNPARDQCQFRVIGPIRGDSDGTVEPLVVP